MWLTTEELMDLGVDILSIASWSGHAPSESVHLRFPAWTVQKLVDKQYRALVY